MGQAASEAFLERKSVRELGTLTDALRRELDEKEQEIQRLRTVTAQGKLQVFCAVLLGVSVLLNHAAPPDTQTRRELISLVWPRTVEKAANCLGREP